MQTQSGHGKIHFTIQSVEDLPIPKKAYATYRDEKCPYLQLYVTAGGIKTFHVRKKVNGRATRYMIGQFPLITIDQARKEAMILCGILAAGKDPHADKKLKRLDTLTFGEHFLDYMERYSKLHKRSWRYDETEVSYHLSHWFAKRMSDITRDEVQRTHERIGINHGIHAANSIVKRVSAIFNKAIDWGWKGTNPALGIKKFKTHSRDRFIQPSEMPFFLQALQDEPDAVFRDFFMILLLTGVRKTNGLQMRYHDINWDRSEWRIPYTKNGDPLLIPLVDEVMQILKRRKELFISQWVFPQEGNIHKHISTPQKPWRNLLARATLLIWAEDPITMRWTNAASAKFPSYLSDALKVERLLALAHKKERLLPGSLMDLRIHDLRRTFGSFQALSGASLPIIGRSLGHKSPQSTMIYARLNLDPVREAISKATQAILQQGTMIKHTDAAIVS